MASSLLFSSIRARFCFARDWPMRASVFRSRSLYRETHNHGEYFLVFWDPPDRWEKLGSTQGSKGSQATKGNLSTP